MSITENCLKSISKAKSLKNLNIFIKETFDSAILQSQQSEKRALQNDLKKSKIDGLIWTVKDNFCTKSVNSTCGSKMLENYVPPYNATVVERILRAGSVLIGKTNMDEFGMGSVSSSHFGTVKNPYNLIRNKTVEDNNSHFFISGGSSGGSAASVSSGIADFSIGSDTGGSVRNPASICGCIGYKPTYGLISRYGLVPLNNYFDTVGIMSNSVDTIVNVLNVVAGPDENDSTSIKAEFKPVRLDDDFNPNKIRIGIPKEFFPNGLSESNLKAWETAVKLFTDNSDATIVPVSLPNSAYSMSCYSVLTSCEIASNFSRFDGLRFGHHTPTNFATDQLDYNFERIITKNRDESLGKVVKSRLVSGNYFLLKEYHLNYFNNFDKYFKKSHQIRQLILADFRRVFDEERVDVLITPTCFHDTPSYAEYSSNEEAFDEKDFFTACVNIAGMPAVSVPSGVSASHGLPVGVQLIADWRRDDLLLNVAEWFVKNNGDNFVYSPVNL